MSVCIGEVGWRVTYNCFVMLQEIYTTAARYVCMVYMYMLGTEHNGVPFLTHICPHTYTHYTTYEKPKENSLVIFARAIVPM